MSKVTVSVLNQQIEEVHQIYEANRALLIKEYAESQNPVKIGTIIKSSSHLCIRVDTMYYTVFQYNKKLICPYMLYEGRKVSLATGKLDKQDTQVYTVSQLDTIMVDKTVYQWSPNIK